MGLLFLFIKKNALFFYPPQHIWNSTTTAGGQLVFHIMGALAEFERSLIIERTKAGLAAAKRRGKYPGRPKSLTPQQIRHAKIVLARGDETTGSLAALFGVDRTTIWRALQKA